MKKLIYTLRFYFFTFFILVALSNPSLVDALDNQTIITNGLNYLRTQQKSDGQISGYTGVSEWVAMAFAGSGVDISSVATESGQTLQNYIQANPPSSNASSTDWSRKILAITATGGSPYKFGDVDYVTKLETFFNNNQLGTTTAINDDVFGLLALLSSKVDKTNQILSASLAFILTHQRSDGGFSYSADLSVGSDIDDTASTLMALQAAKNQGLTAASLDSDIISAKNYILSHQNSDGGFAYDPNPATSWDTSSNVSTTSWVAMALSALTAQNEEAYTKALNYLQASQQADGSFPYQPAFPPGDTFDSSYAIVALAGKYWPIGYFSGLVPGQAALPQTITPSKINSLLTGGSFSVPATASASLTPYITASSQVTINLASGEGSSSVMLPSGTVITRTDGISFSSDDLSIETITPTSLSGFSQTSIKAAVQWGIPNVSVSFSSPISLNIFVGTSLNGQTLNILRSTSSDSGWTNDGLVSPGTCLIVSGLCSFQTSKASYFVTTQAATTSSSDNSSSSSSSSTNSTTTSSTSSSTTPTSTTLESDTSTQIIKLEQDNYPTEEILPTPKPTPEVLGTTTKKSQMNSGLPANLAKILLWISAFFLLSHIYNIYRKRRIKVNEKNFFKNS